MIGKMAQNYVESVQLNLSYLGHSTFPSPRRFAASRRHVLSGLTRMKWYRILDDDRQSCFKYPEKTCSGAASGIAIASRSLDIPLFASNFESL